MKSVIFVENTYMDELYSLGFLLNRASFSLAKALRAEFKKSNLDLPHSQFIVLRCLFYKDALSQQELATTLSKDAAAIKRTVDNLEAKGLVNRVQVSQRQNAIVITPKGHEILPAAMKCANRLQTRILTSIGKANSDLIHKLLHEIYNSSGNAE